MSNNKSPLPFTKTYIGLNDITSPTINRSKLIDKVSEFPVSDSLLVLSELDRLLTQTPKRDKSEQRKLVNLIFDDETGSELKGLIDSDSVLFHRQQIYLCMSYILRYGDKSLNIKKPYPEKVQEKFLEQVGLTLLYMNDFCSNNPELVGPKSVKAKKAAGIMWQLGQFAINSEDRDIGAELARSYLVYNESDQGEKISAEFKDVVGVALDKFWAIIFALYGKWSKRTDFLVENPFLDRAEYFQDCKELSEEDIDKTLGLLSADLNTLKEVHEKRIQDFEHEEMNFEFIKENPLLRFKQKYICLSLPYLVNKVTRKLPDILRRELGGQEFSGRIGNELGEAYGGYVRRHLYRVYNKGDDLVTRARHKKFNGIEISDGVIDYNDQLIFIEVKAGTMKIKRKLSNNYRVIEKAVGKFLIERGAAQLEDRIEEFRAGKTKIAGIDPKKVQRYWPVLITCIDELPQHKNLTSYYDTLLEQHGVLQQDYLAPLTILGLKDFEALMNLVQETGESFIELIREKNLNNRFSELSVFKYIAAEKDQSALDRPKHLDEKLDELYETTPKKLGLEDS